MNQAEAREILEKAEYWHYAFRFPWGETVPGKKGWKERVELRKKHLFTPLLEQNKGSFQGKRVLDLGCCQGYWSFESRKAGARSVLGIDSSEAFIMEARAVRTILGIDECSFSHAHLEEEAWWDLVGDPRDIVLMLGVFYHLTDPVHVLRKAMEMTEETLVIDGEVVVGDAPAFYLRKRTPGEPTTERSGMTSSLRSVGTVSAIVELLKDGGFKSIQVLSPAKDMPADYHAGTTVSIIASRA